MQDEILIFDCSREIEVIHHRVFIMVITWKESCWIYRGWGERTKSFHSWFYDLVAGFRINESVTHLVTDKKKRGWSHQPARPSLTGHAFNRGELSSDSVPIDDDAAMRAAPPTHPTDTPSTHLLSFTAAVTSLTSSIEHTMDMVDLNNNKSNHQI